MVKTGSYYSALPLEEQLAKEFSQMTLIDSNMNDNVKKVKNKKLILFFSPHCKEKIFIYFFVTPCYYKQFFAVSAMVSSIPPESFVFRNYQYPIFGSKSRYNGTCRETIVKAIRASTAAPGYFDAVEIGDNRFQDGGLGSNNW